MDSTPAPEHAPQIRLHQDGRSIALSPGLSAEELREGQLLFEVRCSENVRIRFDDQPLSVVWTEQGRAGYGQVDLTNQVGFHRFSLRTQSGEASFDFRTTTAKPAGSRSANTTMRWWRSLP